MYFHDCKRYKGSKIYFNNAILFSICYCISLGFFNPNWRGRLNARKRAKEKYKAKLSGKNEIPKVKSTAKGSASFKSKKESINWKINITGISNITGANFYLGNNSLKAEPIVNLMKVSNVSKTSTGLLMNGLITTTDLQGPMQGKTLDALKSQMNSSQTFVNILTKDHPGGEIAGPVKLRPQTNTTITSNSTGNLTQVR